MKSKGMRIEKSGEYVIQIQGDLDPDWSDRLGGLSIETKSFDDDRLPVTILSGNLIDQASLQGVLNTLYELRLPLLSVECLDNELDTC